MAPESTQNFLFNNSLFKIILNPSKKVEFSSENQKDMSVDGIEMFGCPMPILFNPVRSGLQSLDESSEAIRASEKI